MRDLPWVWLKQCEGHPNASSVLSKEPY